MKKTIPEKTITVCDMCGRDDSTGTPRFRKNASVEVKRHALDMLGDPAANGSYSLDLCDECEGVLTATINDLIVVRKKKN